MSLPAKLVEKFDLGRSVRVVQVQCAATEPTFTVYMSGDTSTAVEARRVAGQTFAAGDYGLALWAPPMAPICFKTA